MLPSVIIGEFDEVDGAQTIDSQMPTHRDGVLITKRLTHRVNRDSSPGIGEALDTPDDDVYVLFMAGGVDAHGDELALGEESRVEVGFGGDRTEGIEHVTEHSNDEDDSESDKDPPTSTRMPGGKVW